jgi:hypothetical protein
MKGTVTWHQPFYYYQKKKKREREKKEKKTDMAPAFLLLSEACV